MQYLRLETRRGIVLPCCYLFTKAVPNSIRLYRCLPTSGHGKIGVTTHYSYLGVTNWHISLLARKAALHTDTEITQANSWC